MRSTLLPGGQRQTYAHESCSHDLQRLTADGAGGAP